MRVQERSGSISPKAVVVAGVGHRVHVSLPSDAHLDICASVSGFVHVNLLLFHSP